MKRLITLLLILTAFLTIMNSALAENSLTIEQESFHVIGKDSLAGYLFVKLANHGNVPIKVDQASLEIYDSEGKVIGSSTSLWRFAEYLKPGEYTYAYFNPRLEGVESANEVADYMVEISERELANRVTFRLPTESVMEEDGSITTTLVNDMDQTVFDIVIVRVLLDEQGNILFLDSDNMYSYKGLTPGSSIVLRRQVSSNFRSYFEEKGIVPAQIDTIGYAYGLDENTYTRGGSESVPEEEKTESASENQSTEEVEYPTLERGSKGDEVRKLQQRLKDLGYLSGKVDGDYGKGTAGAISAFQEKTGLEVTGVADEATQKALFSNDAPGA